MSKCPSPSAEAGRCTCGTRIVRGEDNTGSLVDVDITAVDAATELNAYTQGEPSFVLSYSTARDARGLHITRRTRTDIKRRPPGFNRDRVVLLHDCTRKGTA